MSVKTIFKVLIGVIVTIVISFLIIEMYNINLMSQDLVQLTKLAAKQSAVLFSQETYKLHEDGDAFGGTIAMQDIYDSNGNFYISGDFYQSDVAENIYTNLYTSDNFKNWLKNEEAVEKGNWHNLELINKALNNPESLTYDVRSEDYADSMTALLYKNVMMTPLNLGIPYLDEDTMNRMFRWNLAQLLSNCNENMIRTDENGDTYVYYSGYRVYVQNARISNLDYKTFDLTNLNDRKEFSKYTHIDPDNLGFEYDQEALGIDNEERERVCIVGINYTIPVSYEGITPFKTMFDYVWDTEVEGYHNDGGRNSHQEFDNTAKADLTAGGFNGWDNKEGVLPVPGKLIYYVIR